MRCADAQQRDSDRWSAPHDQLKVKWDSHRGLLGSLQKGGPLFPQEASNAPVLEDMHRSLPCPQECPLPPFRAARPLTRAKCQYGSPAGGVLGLIREDRDYIRRVRLSQHDLRGVIKGAKR